MCVDAVDAYTQTVGVYPESLKIRLRDRLCRWIVCEDCDPAVTPPLWNDGTMFKSVALPREGVPT